MTQHPPPWFVRRPRHTAARAAPSTLERSFRSQRSGSRGSDCRRTLSMSGWIWCVACFTAWSIHHCRTMGRGRAQSARRLPWTSPGVAVATAGRARHRIGPCGESSRWPPTETMRSFSARVTPPRGRHTAATAPHDFQASARCSAELELTRMPARTLPLRCLTSTWSCAATVM